MSTYVRSSNFSSYPSYQNLSSQVRSLRIHCVFFIFRTGKQEARKWHVTLQDVNNADDTCNGLQIGENWVITRHNCSRVLFGGSKSQVKVKIGRRESRKIALSIDYPNEANAVDFDMKLIRLVDRERRKRKPKDIPCLLTHTQYFQLSRALSEGVSTSHTFRKNSNRLLARRGKLLNKCEGNTDICFKIKGNANDVNFYGSPLSLRYQGLWYVAGIGTGTNRTAKERSFTPLWGVADWVANAMHEIDSKCNFQSTNGDTRTLCENLKISGVEETRSFQ